LTVGAPSAWLEAFLHNPRALAYSLDAEGRYSWVGGHAKGVLGWGADEMVGHDPVALLAPPTDSPLRRHLAAKRAGLEEHSTYEARVTARDGRAVWLEVTSRAERAADGTLLAIHGVALDVTDRRRAVEAVQRSRGYLDEFLEAAHDVVYLHDLQGRFLMVNGAASRLFGYTRDEFLRMAISAIIDPAHLPRAAEQMRLKTEGKMTRSLPYEILTRTKSGRAVWMEVSTSAVLADGKPVAVQGIARNINERKANEQALRLVQRVAAAVQAGTEFSEVLTVACEGLGEATGCARVEGWVPTPDGRLQLAAAWPSKRSVQEEKFHRLSVRSEFTPGSGIAARATRDGCPVWVADVLHEPAFLRAASAHAAGYRSLMAVPLLHEGRLVSLLLLFTAQADPASPPWQGLVESVASQLGAAIARRRSQQGLELQAEVLGLQMELAPLAVLLVGADGAILGANHRLLELFGMAGAPVLRPFDETFARRLPDPQAFLAKARDVYEADRRGAGELRIGQRVLQRVVAELPGRDGVPLGHAVFLRDVTQERSAEDALKARRELAASGPA
jgi:PAS domain S-box-containing protein